MGNHSGKQKVLIVDDSPENIQVLMECLCDDYATVAATDGLSALAMAGCEPAPDIILLDIKMPGIDGYEVCSRLKKNPQLRDIPVIFLSVLESAEVKVKAFKSGGVDYITKPFQVEEVQARVKTHLLTRKLQCRLERHNQCLEQTVTQRTRELETAYERLSILDKIKSDFLRMISHEMRTPLNGLLGISELVFDLCPPSSEKNQYQLYYQQSRQRMEQLLEDSMLIITLDSSPLNVRHDSIPFEDILAAAFGTIEGIEVVMEHSTELNSVMICCDLELIKRALVILIKLANCFNVGKDRIALAAVLTTNTITINLSLDSLSLSLAEADELFELTSNVRGGSHAQELGLAPVVAERIITLFGGTVCFNTDAEKNCFICMTLPVDYQNRESLAV